MKYTFLSLEESGNGSDYIMAVERRPNLLERLTGEHAETIEYFGPRPHWIGMDGMEAPRQIENVLEGFWSSHPHPAGPLAGAKAWRELEPGSE